MEFRIMTKIFQSRCALVLLIGAIAANFVGCNWVSQNHNVSGVSNFQNGNFAAADQAFRQAIQADPSNPDGYYNMAALYHRVAKTQNRPADWQQAESYYQQCLAHNPRHTDCYRGLAVLLSEQNRSNESVALLQRWIQVAPGNSEPFVELARLSEEQGDKGRAEQFLLDSIRLEPNNPRALAALGKLREDAGDYAQAALNYQRSLAVNQFQPQLVNRLAAMQRQYAPQPQNFNNGAPAGNFGPLSNDPRLANQPNPQNWTRQ
jgi:tetratricopeptide (TPR) repeat protein